MAEWKVTLYMNTQSVAEQSTFSRVTNARNRAVAVKQVREEYRDLFPNGAPPERVTARRTERDTMDKQDWRDLREGVASGDVPNPLGGQ